MSSSGTIRKSVVSHHYCCRVLPLLLEPWDYTRIRWRKMDTQRNKQKSQLLMNNHETEGGCRGLGRTQPTTFRNTNTGSTLYFFYCFYFLTRRRKVARKRQSNVRQFGRIFFVILLIIIRNETPAGNRSLQQGNWRWWKARIKQCGWGASPTMLIGTTGLSPPPREAGCSVKDFGALQINADVEMLNLIFCMKTYSWKLGREKIIMKKIIISMTHLLSQAEYICPFTRLIWWLALILS